MTHPWLVVLRLLLVAAGLLLCLLASRRGWRPALGTTLAVALVLRLAMLALVQDVRPYDLINDFHAAGANILAHRDPILHARPTGWNYTPLYAFVLAPLVWLEQHAGVPWPVLARLPAIAFDLGVVVLVGVLAGRETGALRRFQYACLPLPILIAAVHGQMEPLCLLLALGAFAAARRPWLAGALLGLAVSVKSWPLLFLPALLLGLRTRADRLRAAAGAAAVPVLFVVTLPLTGGTPLSGLPRVVEAMGGYSPNVGTWGWPAVLLEIRPADPSIWEDPFYAAVRKIGALLTLAVVLAVLWHWRRAGPVDAALASGSAFQAVTAAHGVQYLLWPTPFLAARPTPGAGWFHLAAGLYAAFGYLVMTDLDAEAYTAWESWYSLASLLVIAAIPFALPWRRSLPPGAAPRPPVPAAGSTTR